MIFSATSLDGAVLIDLDVREDDRGFFARTWCRREFAEHGLETALAQCSLSFNRCAGTLRGLHFQRPPHEETKLVRCTSGAIFDVIVDLRPGSPSYRRWQGFELSAANRRSLYVPRGFAHGFQTLDPASEVTYQIDEFYAPEVADGLRYDDPALAIGWPLPVTAISDKDRSWPLLAPAAA